MDILRYAVRKRPREVEGDAQAVTADCQDKRTCQDPPDQPLTANSFPSSSSKQLTKAEKKKKYKSHLTCNPRWEAKYSWLYCNKVCFVECVKKEGHLLKLLKGGWTTRGI